MTRKEVHEFSVRCDQHYGELEKAFEEAVLRPMTEEQRRAFVRCSMAMAEFCEGMIEFVRETELGSKELS